MLEKIKNKYLTKNCQETKLLAKEFAKKLKGGEVIALIGDLGSGKTSFTKGMAEGLCIKENVTSPTFLLLKQYKIKKTYGLKLTADSLIHIDCYRMKSVQDALSIGITDYLNKKDTICVIEWADKIKKIIPKNIIVIKFKHIDGNKREITFRK